MNGMRNRVCDGGTELHGPLVHAMRLAADEKHLRGKWTERLGDFERSRRYGGVHVDFAGVADVVDDQRVNRARFSTTRGGVNDDEPIEGRHQFLREANSSGTDVKKLDRITRHTTLAETAKHFDAETDVAAEHIAESGDEGASHDT